MATLVPAKAHVTSTAVRDAIVWMQPLQVGVGISRATETVAMGPGAGHTHLLLRECWDKMYQMCRVCNIHTIDHALRRKQMDFKFDT